MSELRVPTAAAAAQLLLSDGRRALVQKRRITRVIEVREA